MIRKQHHPRTMLAALLVAMTLPATASDDAQPEVMQPQTEPQAPQLTQRVRCTINQVLGCSGKRPYCSDDDSVLEDVSGGRPTFYELDLLRRIAQLHGKDEQGVTIQIDRIGFAPGLDVVNVQGINEGWMPWTLSYQTSTGEGVVVEATPGFTTLYLVNCAVSNSDD